MPARMMVAVETISEENIKVSDVLPNSSEGASTCIWMSANSSASLIENAVDHPEEGDADVIECCGSWAAQLALGSAPSNRNT